MLTSVELAETLGCRAGKRIALWADRPTRLVCIEMHDAALRLSLPIQLQCPPPKVAPSWGEVTGSWIRAEARADEAQSQGNMSLVFHFDNC